MYVGIYYMYPHICSNGDDMIKYFIWTLIVVNFMVGITNAVIGNWISAFASLVPCACVILLIWYYR